MSTVSFSTCCVTVFPQWCLEVLEVQNIFQTCSSFNSLLCLFLHIAIMSYPPRHTIHTFLGGSLFKSIPMTPFRASSAFLSLAQLKALAVGSSPYQLPFWVGPFYNDCRIIFLPQFPHLSPRFKYLWSATQKRTKLFTRYSPHPGCHGLLLFSGINRINLSKCFYKSWKWGTHPAPFSHSGMWDPQHYKCYFKEILLIKLFPFFSTCLLFFSIDKDSLLDQTWVLSSETSLWLGPNLVCLVWF